MTHTTTGTSMFSTGSGGATTELIALGAMDIYLVRGASVTFFRFRYARHTNFALEAVAQPFNTQPCFGGHSQIILQRAGDLIYFMYVVIDLPAIKACQARCREDDDRCGIDLTHQFPTAAGCGTDCNPCQDSDDRVFRHIGRCEVGSDAGSSVQIRAGRKKWRADNYGACYDCGGSECSEECESLDSCTRSRPWAHWSNAIGQLLIRRATLVVGGHQTDVLYSDYLYMWEELSGKAGKRLAEMIGKRRSRQQLIKDARVAQRLYVPLPFYFTQTSGNALPLCSLQYHGVQIQIEWEQLKKAVVRSDDCVKVVKCCDGQPLCNADLRAYLDTTYVHLDVDERNRFSLADFDQLMSQVQFLPVCQKGCNIKVSLSFNHPIIELIWAVRRKCKEDANNYFNYSGIDGRDPIEEVSLRLNNLYRFSGREGKYYRLVQPYQHHSSIPQAHVYCYSFALMPEEPNPTGSCNFSRIDNVDMDFILQDGLQNENVTILIFARNWNILRFYQGVGGALFNA